MALRKDFNYKEIYVSIEDESKSIELPITVSNAYIKIETVSGNKNSINILVGVYQEDKTTKEHSSLYSFTPSVDDESENFIKQGYEYLKTLEEYAECIDC